MTQPKISHTRSGPLTRLCANRFCENSIGKSVFISNKYLHSTGFYYCSFCGVDICERCVWQAPKDMLDDVLPALLVEGADLKKGVNSCCPYCGLPLSEDRNEI